MSHARVFIKRIISPDGKIVAEAKSMAIASADRESTTSQVVTVNISSGNSCSSSSASSASSIQ